MEFGPLPQIPLFCPVINVDLCFLWRKLSDIITNFTKYSCFVLMLNTVLTFVLSNVIFVHIHN